MSQRTAADCTDAELLDQAACWPLDRNLPDLSVERLRAIADTEGVDFATALLYDRLLRSPRHRPFIQCLDNLSPEPLEPLPATVVVVPGAFYVESPHTGADGQLVLEEAARFGCRAARIPLQSFGGLHANTELLCRWLRDCEAEAVVLVSLSKGAAEMRLALERSDAAAVFRNVVCWVDLAGMVWGTPLATWLLNRPWRTLLVRCLFWYKGYSFPVIRELERTPEGPLGGFVRLPPHLHAIHVVGFPRSRHLTTPLARRGHRRLGPLGPNDGAVLLGDVTRLPGQVYPVWGADHYLRPRGRDMRPLVGKILRYLADHPSWLCPGRTDGQSVQPHGRSAHPSYLKESA